MAPRPRVAALLAASAVGGFATAVMLSDEARGDLISSLTLPTITLPTLPTGTTPTIPPLPPPPPIPPAPLPPPPPLPPAPPAPLIPPPPPGQPPGGGGTGSSGGSGGDASGSSNGSASAGSNSASARARAARAHATRRRFSTRGSHRGTTISFRLARPATVIFTVRGPSPSCGVVGTKAVHGRSGVNRVRLTGRFDGRPLAPGTYRIDVTARRGGSDKRIGRIAVQVVPPGSRLRWSAPPAFHCVSSPPLPAFASSVSAAGGGGVLGETSGPARGSAPKTTKQRSGGLQIPPFRLYSDSSLWSLVFDLLSYIVLGISGAIFVVYAARYVRHRLRSP